MTQSDTVIRIEPPRKDAAPSKAYLKIRKYQMNISGETGSTTLQKKKIIQYGRGSISKNYMQVPHKDINQ